MTVYQSLFTDGGFLSHTGVQVREYKMGNISKVQLLTEYLQLYVMWCMHNTHSCDLQSFTIICVCSHCCQWFTLKSLLHHPPSRSLAVWNHSFIMTSTEAAVLCLQSGCLHTHFLRKKKKISQFLFTSSLNMVTVSKNLNIWLRDQHFTIALPSIQDLYCKDIIQISLICYMKQTALKHFT